MATVINDPQAGLEDEVLVDADLQGAMSMFQEADEAWTMADGAKLSKARDDAKAKVFAMLPPHDGKPHVYRIGPWKITEAPPGPERDTHVVPKNPTRRVTKVVEDE
jgi:hypothetical protein